MAPTDPFAEPSVPKVLVSLGVGIAVGFAIALPVIGDDVAAVDLGGPGPIGNVLLIGVLAVAVVTTGMFALYQLFWLVDR